MVLYICYIYEINSKIVIVINIELITVYSLKYVSSPTSLLRLLHKLSDPQNQTQQSEGKNRPKSQQLKTPITHPRPALSLFLTVILSLNPQSLWLSFSLCIYISKSLFFFNILYSIQSSAVSPLPAISFLFWIPNLLRIKQNYFL